MGRLGGHHRSEAGSLLAAALAALVAIQDGRFHGHGGFVILPEWADILYRHFPARRRLAQARSGSG
ncbi:hypothetical protein [Nonomuraea wenchangensis]|uniref:hypothetical protein n=1 Tax=Nonomuraea wenchangensis TaxID=568860 RepID=UPI00331D5C13